MANKIKGMNLSEKEIDELLENKPSIFNAAILMDLKNAHSIINTIEKDLKASGFSLTLPRED